MDRDWIGVSKNEAAKKMQASGENILVQKGLKAENWMVQEETKEKRRMRWKK